MSLSIGLQLFSIKEETEKDFSGALRRVAEIGYQGVEFAGYGGLSSSELKALLQELKLKPCGSHVGLKDLTENLDQVIEYNLEIGNPYIICPNANYSSKEDFISMGDTLTKIAEKCSKHGLKVGYHNHSHEMQLFDGELGLDLIYKNTDPGKVQAEIDTYWVEYAGVNPSAYVKKHAARCELLHIKDMEIVEGIKRSTEIGNGIMDIKTLVETAKTIDVKWLIVEQEFFTKPLIESVNIDYKNLKKLI